VAPGIIGISHLFEHMMFNGAKKYGPGQFDRAGRPRSRAIAQPHHVIIK
jgi:predicted Zn-dependent peptidase